MTFLPLRWVRGQASGMALTVTDATTPPAGAGVAPARDATATPGDACRGGGWRCVAALREGGGRRCVAEERDGSWAARCCGRSGRGGGRHGGRSGREEDSATRRPERKGRWAPPDRRGRSGRGGGRLGPAVRTGGEAGAAAAGAVG
ncbi:hypothetical protein PVAP13_3KG164854 [Panicum virgatum]|uniref:Uncharacterized protein n=1 Tax=Panicum virgatum TaxID=38727 RepID=A0A8T0UVV0_PANVG|nr:hypothetical protein PVAP13_3KG164854 [Panicum virgatum]